MIALLSPINEIPAFPTGGQGWLHAIRRRMAAFHGEAVVVVHMVDAYGLPAAMLVMIASMANSLADARAGLARISAPRVRS